MKKSALHGALFLPFDKKVQKGFTNCPLVCIILVKSVNGRRPLKPPQRALPWLKAMHGVRGDMHPEDAVGNQVSADVARVKGKLF